MGDGEVLKYEDIVLRESDLDTLQGPCFLTDQIIAFYFSYLSSSEKNLSSSCKTDDILLVPPSTSILLANCDDDKERLVLFVVNDCDDFCGGDSGSHWSTLVYSRSMNAFLHLDSMSGANNLLAEKLYDAVKNYMGIGGEVPRKQTSSSLKKQKNKNKRVQPVSKSSLKVANAAPVGLPVFKEWKEMPQQSNGYDCGIYALAIAGAIVDWFSNGMDSNDDVLSVVAKRVDQSVEVRMRGEILELVQDLRKKLAH
ncbi:hypothetical protein RND81_07G103500 [Saponaria officinalis]|uniref:Ubiquitin-like protease family profile domain-containing protein n=1 Tax=Saponaria officinalis TaxID=3572 RepID=A0AAW1JPC9_SAPOF